MHTDDPHWLWLNINRKHIVEYEKGGILIPVSPVSSYHGRLLSSSHSPARTFLDSDQSHLFWGGHTVLGEKTTFDCFQMLFLTPTPVVLGGHVFDYRAVSMLRQTTQRLNVCHNCFATYPHEQWVAFRWYVGLVWGQWASAVTTWSSVLEHLSCDKKHSITDYFQDNYSCCLFLVALVCDARRRSRDQEKKKIKQIWEMFGSSAFLVVLLFGELTFAQASVSFCLLCTSNTVAP